MFFICKCNLLKDRGKPFIEIGVCTVNVLKISSQGISYCQAPFTIDLWCNFQNFVFCNQVVFLECIDPFTTRHKVVHNGGSPNFKELLFDKKTTYLIQILQSLSYKVCSIILPKLTTCGLFIPILGTSAIMDQIACCYNVTTSETGL